MNYTASYRACLTRQCPDVASALYKNEKKTNQLSLELKKKLLKGEIDKLTFINESEKILKSQDPSIIDSTNECAVSHCNDETTAMYKFLASSFESMCKTTKQDPELCDYAKRLVAATKKPNITRLDVDEIRGIVNEMTLKEFDKMRKNNTKKKKKNTKNA